MRAASYYDPEIPTMPQELPFPSDRLMRQGLLYAEAAGVAPAASDTEAVVEVDSVEAPSDDAQRAAALPALDTFADDDDDAFDLDLNP